jgi:tight adherence protein C
MNVATALLLSATLVAGVVLVALSAPWARRPRLAARLDPHLRGLHPVRSRLLDAGDEPQLHVPELLQPMLVAGARTVGSWLGGSASVSRRLREAGRPEQVARFRAEQLLCGLLGFAAGLLAGLGLPIALGRGLMPLAILLLSSSGAMLGALARDWWLSREVARRQARILAEFPTIADLLCLAVTAGEAPRAAIERITRWAHGELAGELTQVLAEVRAGAPLGVALEQLRQRVNLPQVASFVDGLTVALERGTPLADVLRSQAAEVRERHKRGLIEAGGKREVYMLVPVVLLVLPVVVLFALYPGLLSLSLLAP